LTSLAGLPPDLVIGAGRDDARAYAERLDEAGVDVAYVEYAETMHAFLNLCGVLSSGNHAIDLIATALREEFGPR
jgi:acetyl esterase